MRQRIRNWMNTIFVWDDRKDRFNRLKHGASFAEAQLAFMDPDRIIAVDRKHSASVEKR